MVQVRLLAPWTNDKGEPQAAGAVIGVDEETATVLSNRGMISRLDDEKALLDQQQKEGVYDAALTRDKVEGTTPRAPEPPSQAQNQPKKS